MLLLIGVLVVSDVVVGDFVFGVGRDVDVFLVEYLEVVVCGDEVVSCIIVEIGRCIVFVVGSVGFVFDLEVFIFSGEVVYFVFVVVVDWVVGEYVV